MPDVGKVLRYVLLCCLAAVAGILGLVGGFSLVYWAGHLLASDHPGFHAGQGGQFAFFLAGLACAPVGAVLGLCMGGLVAYRVLLWPPASDRTRQVWRKSFRYCLLILAVISAIIFLGLVCLAHIV